MADNEEEKAKKEKSGGGLLPIINLVLLLLVLAVGGFIAWKMIEMEQSTEPGAAVEQTDQTTIPEAEDDTDTPPVRMEIDDIIVNLADTDRDRFLRAKIVLELRNAEALTRVKEDQDEIRALIGKILRSKKFSLIRTPQGQSSLEEELSVRLNRMVGGKPIKKLYFPEFVSQ